MLLNYSNEIGEKIGITLIWQSWVFHSESYRVFPSG